MGLSIHKFSVAHCNDDDAVIVDAADNDLDIALKTAKYSVFYHCFNCSKDYAVVKMTVFGIFFNDTDASGEENLK